jgi:hypothetical protein
MTREEYYKCELAANMYHDKVDECEMLRRMIAQLKQENRVLKERLGYKTARDIQRSKEDAEVFLIVKMGRGV